jgi:hypothetical protein
MGDTVDRIAGMEPRDALDALLLKYHSNPNRFFGPALTLFTAGLFRNPKSNLKRCNEYVCL